MLTKKKEGDGNMIKYRPHKGTLDEAMAESKTFNTVDEMYDYIVSNWNNKGFGQLLIVKEDLCVTESMGSDKRVGWNDFRYVCTKKIGKEVFDVPRCIGLCSIEEMD